MKKLSIIYTFLLILSLPSIALALPVPDTGQTKCYDNSQEITCPEPGEPFYGQDAQYPCNPHSYTKLDKNGDGLPDTATSWVMVRDNVTGLTWEVKTDDGSIHDKDNTYKWDVAQYVFIADLNTNSFGGYDDWRLPTIKELCFIVDIDKIDPSIDTAYFPNTVEDYYWSSTTYAADTSYARSVYFSYGYVSGYNKSGYNCVRAVRDGQDDSFNFVDNEDSTVTDTKTGLMWEVKTDDEGPRDKDNKYNWGKALSYCENLTLADYNDWRLPDRNELQSLVDYSQWNPSIDTTFFPNTVSDDYYYWSSTTAAYSTSHAWFVYFSYGGVDYFGKSGYNCVRAVRAGQCGSFDTSTTTTVASTTTVDGSTTTTIDGETTTTSVCPTETIYGEYSEETELLKYFRDNILSKTPEGQEIIRQYYQWSPIIVKAMEGNEGFKEEIKEMIDSILPMIRGEVK